MFDRFLNRQDKQPEKARRKRRNFRLNGRMRERCVELPPQQAAELNPQRLKQINAGIYSWKSAGQRFHL